MKNCKIVQDLLPNYIENLTSQETNDYIKEHLKECTECTEMLENMNKDLEINSNKNYKKETKYLKKYNKKLSTLKFILIAIILIYVSMIGRKIIIIRNIQNNISKYIESNNYHIKTYYYKNDVISVYEAYVKENKNIEKEYYIASLDKKDINSFNKIKYSDGNRDNYYIETQGHKLATINRKPILNSMMNIKNDTKTNNLIQLILVAVTSNITNDICNGIDCYKINFSIIWDSEGNATKYKVTEYINKENGLVIRYIDGNNINADVEDRFGEILDYRYEFDMVNDDEFIEPNIDEYELNNDILK